MNRKDYSVWHKIKTKINNDKKRPYFHEREIWFCSLGENIGHEQDGAGEEYLRPVIILKKFSQQKCFIVPLTTTPRIGDYHFQILIRKTGVYSIVLFLDARSIDSKRLKYKVESVPSSEFVQLKEKLMQIIA